MRAAAVAVIVSVSAMGAAGCWFDARTPSGAVVLCDSAADCQVGQACAAAGRCVDVDAIDSDAPELLSSSTAPERVGPGMRVTATLRFDEPLQAPAVVAMVAGGSRYPLDLDEDDGYARLIDASMPSGSYSLEASATDVNLNRTEVDIGAVVVDTTGPLVLSVAPVDPAVRVGATIEVNVTLDDAAATAHGVATERSSGQSRELLATVEGRLAVDADTAGTWDIVVTGIDDLGNVGPPRGGATVVVDARAPALTDAAIEIIAPPDARRSDVSAATVGSIVRVSFSIDEDAAQPPEVTLQGAASPLSLESGEARLFRFVTTIDETTLEGDLALRASVVDDVGNTALLELGTLHVDRTPPDAPDGLRYLYARRPWTFDGGDRFVVVGEPGAAQAGGRVLVVDADDPGAPALALADADPTGASRLVLPPVDRARVRVIEVDKAGNASAPSLVRRVSWVAAFGGKTPGDTLSNPHRALLLDGVPRAPRDRRVEIREEVGDELALADGAVARVEVRPTWRVVEPLGPPAYDTAPSATYDPQRGASIVVGMNAFLGDAQELPFMFDGQWQEQLLLGPRPSPSGALVVADLARGTTLLLDVSNRSWILDGNAATQRGALPTRYAPALAADVTRRRVVAFGGAEIAFAPTYWLNDTWSWDGFTWEPVETMAAPSPRVTSMAFDPVGGGIVMFGGSGPDGLLGDTWRFDGASWTELSPPASPPPLAPAALLSDPDHDRVLLIAAAGAWAWDGTTWEPDAFAVPPAPPPGLFAGVGASLDGGSGAPLLFISNEPAVHRGVEPSWQPFGADVTSLPAAFSIAPDPSRGGALISIGGTPIANAHRAVTENGYRALPLASGPTANDPVSTYDSAQDVVLLVSGGLTWSWDGAWTNRGAAPALTALTFDVGDPGGGRVVGVGASGTWAWSGVDWTLVGPAPPGVVGRHLAYDPQSDALLALEERANNTPLGATLTRGAAGWQAASTEGIDGHSFSLTLDEDAGRLILTGGQTPVSCAEFVGCFGGYVLDVTLEWDGNGWFALDTERTFSIRAGHQSAFVSSLGGVLVTPGTAEETFVLHRAPRAAQMIELALAASGLPLESIVRLTPVVVSRATGGAQLSGYLTYPGRFSVIAADIADAQLLTADVTDPATLRGLVAGPSAVFVIAGSTGGAALEVDAASLEVEFELPDA